MIGIYKITNKRTNQCYIGQSKELERRIYSHMSSRENSRIDQAIKKEPLNFTYEIIECCSLEELNEREIYWISYYDSYVDGYNRTPGGTFYTCPTKDSVSLLSDEDIRLIRACYADMSYHSGAEVQRKFFPHLDRHLIAQVYNGQLRQDIMPEVYEDNYVHSYTKTRQLGDKNPAAILNVEDVKHMRILYMDNTRQTIFALFPQYNERLITSIISGQNWGHLPIYRKKQKRWTYPEGWTEVQIQQFQDEVNNYRKEININENNK